MKLKQKRPMSSIILYVSASIIAILGCVLLVSNILLYHTNVAQYVAQGTAIAAVKAQLIPAQLIPGIFQPICVYWGIALLLICAGIINEKVSKCLLTLTENEVCKTSSEKSDLKQNTYVKVEEPIEETSKDTETIS